MIATVLIAVGAAVVTEDFLQKKTGPLKPAYAPANLAPSPAKAGVNATTTPAKSPAAPFIDPLSDARSRVTKKTFGIRVDPKHSPVSPERFTGYHTGVDFETTPAEQDADVPIYAICSGKLLVKEYGSGYGGVASEGCTLDNAPVTVVYGHLRLSSITAKAGAALEAGETIGVLGKGYSAETDGERKHLHLGIHKGAAVNLHGYVATEAELSAWIDPLTVIP